MDVVVEEEQEAPSDVVHSTLDSHPSYGQREEALEVENDFSPCGTFRERNKPHIFSSYMGLMSHIIDAKPSSFEEAIHKLKASMQRFHDGGVPIHHVEWHMGDCSKT